MKNIEVNFCCPFCNRFVYPYMSACSCGAKFYLNKKKITITSSNLKGVAILFKQPDGTYKMIH